MTARYDFLRNEFLALSFMGASQHVRIYADGVGEADRVKLRNAVRERLKAIESKYANGNVSESEHVANIAALADGLSAEFAPLLADGRFRIGPAQKALNLYLKYLWCAGWIHRPPHCPVDAIVLGEAGHVSILWSKIESIDSYREAIAILREAAGGMPLADWELEAWRKGKAGTARGMSHNAPCNPAFRESLSPDRKPVKQASPPCAGMTAALLCASMLFAAIFPEVASAQPNVRYEHMEYGISTAQRLAAAREALRDDTFPELSIPANVENFVAIATACEKYPAGAVRQTCADAGKVRLRDRHQAAQPSDATGSPRSIAEQAREVQATAAAREAAAADKEATKQRFRELKYQLSGWDEHNAYDRCMQERDRSEASNPPPRDRRDRRPSEPVIPPLDIVETCVSEAKQQVAEEKQRKAEASAAADERYRAAKEKLAACEKSPEAQVARSANEIVQYRFYIEIAKQHLERDKAIERTTGVIDVKGRQSDGEILVDAPPLMEDAFKVYRQAGGTARSVEDVKGMDDPCKALR